MHARGQRARRLRIDRAEVVNRLVSAMLRFVPPSWLDLPVTSWETLTTDTFKPLYDAAHLTGPHDTVRRSLAAVRDARALAATLLGRRG